MLLEIEEIEMKNNRRLSAMERSQAETNKRLQDVMKSIMNLQGMLETVSVKYVGDARQLDRSKGTIPDKAGGSS